MKPIITAEKQEKLQIVSKGNAHIVKTCADRSIAVPTVVASAVHSVTLDGRFQYFVDAAAEQ